ncbi:C-type lectin domain family 10 member A-like [Castor canadensis]|uniref:C-type lectin domain family 10 member A-like n=2 Tax=Castor canadensis TaxID=51338 RepID=A0A8C0XAF9_CASCN|nr:C-type lectin domain family 10 member A-like [Castor canadensis]
MTMKFENFQDVGCEEKNLGTGKVTPLQSILRNICSGTCLFLISLGFSFLLLVVVCVIGSQNSQLRRDLVTLRTTFSNITSHTEADIQTLTSQGHSLQETIKFLKVQVEDHRQELQTARSLNEKVVSLESTFEKKEEEFKADQSDMVLQIKELEKDLRSLTCELAHVKSNGSVKTCCPLNWVEHKGSCYWFSQSGKSWSQADRYCQLENAHLVVVNSMEEQKFLQDHMGQVVNWMGLTDQNGPWRWVDGTDYDKGFKNWSPLQPDNWHGHGLGGGEDCAHFTWDGRWNDDVCERLYHWVCETELGKAS